jgi:septin family protein
MMRTLFKQFFSEMNQKIRNSDFDIKLPFRITLVGQMDSGKSTFIYNFLLNFQKVTNITSIKKAEVIFCYNYESSLKGIKEACEESKIFEKVQFIKFLPPLKDIESYHNSLENTEIILIFEDLQNYMKSLSKEQIYDLGKHSFI